MEHFRLPSMGSGLREARIVEWAVALGDQVEAGDLVCRIETEKSVIDLPSPLSGRICCLGAAAGEDVKVGAVLFSVDTPNPSYTGAAKITDSAANLAGEPPDEPPVIAQATGTRPAVSAMPAVRKLAEQLGVDLSMVRGSGPNGRILQADVRLAASTPSPAVRVRSRFVEFSNTRRTIAERLSTSWKETPHVFMREIVDMTAVIARRTAIDMRAGRALPIEALLIEAVIPCLKQVPGMNARCDAEGIEYFGHYDIGVAVATESGLKLPVVVAADALSLEQLGDAVRGLVVRARGNALLVSDTRPPTFSVNNVGAIGSATGTSIIPFGTSAVVSIGRISPTPMVLEDVVCARPAAELSLSFDHRVLDGDNAQQFLAAVIQRLIGKSA